jgi:hypothetical protein
MKFAALLSAVAALNYAASAETLSRFSGQCIVALVGHAAYRTVCMSQDLPIAGQNNRFRIIIFNARAHIPVARSADYLRTEATIDGHMRVSSLLIGTIEITPASQSVRDAMAAAAPSWEIRPHRVSLYPAESGAVELLIEEPQTDFTGEYNQISPSLGWLADHLSALQLLSHAH